jgi:hypothetical protein
VFSVSSLFSWLSFSSGLYRYQCIIKNGRFKKCFRANVFKLAQQFRGYKALEVSGIGVNAHDIVVDVCFKEEGCLLDFQGAIRDHCGSKRLRDDAEDSYVHSVVDEVQSRLYFNRNLIRIFGSDYSPHAADTNNSPPCDSEGDSLSIYSGVIANIHEAEVRVQMLENHNGIFLFGQQPGKCHIKDKARCNKALNEAADPNNHLYMSRMLHQHFDGIETIPTMTPSFLVQYLSHEDTMIDCPIWDDAHVINLAVKRQKVTVEIVFRDKEFCDILQIHLRNGSIRTSERVYRMDLYFEDASKAKSYLLWKAKKTIRMWAEVDILYPD